LIRGDIDVRQRHAANPAIPPKVRLANARAAFAAGPTIWPGSTCAGPIAAAYSASLLPNRR
jgi:hypothetical protein